MVPVAASPAAANRSAGLSMCPPPVRVAPAFRRAWGPVSAIRVAVPESLTAGSIAGVIRPWVMPGRSAAAS